MSNSGFLGGGIGPTAIKRRSGRWYTAGGSPMPVIAYQPKGAASLAASYVNLANPGTYNAAPGTAPTFTTATGWTFAEAQLLRTGYVAANNALNPQSLTMIVRFSNASSGIAAGAVDANVKGIRIWPTNGTALIASSGNSVTLTGKQTSAGIIVVAGGTIYLDGISIGTVTGAAIVSLPAIVIGAQDYNGTISGPYIGKIQAFALYESVLTASQVAAVSAAMAAL